VKGLISIAMYGGGVVIAVLCAPVKIGDTSLGAMIPVALYVGVAVMWLVPDRRFLHDHPGDARG
jgi:hypothetical protein